MTTEYSNFLKMTTQKIYVLESLIVDILQRNPDGISEHELITELSTNNNAELNSNVYASELSLFQNHFMLFHCLYSLRDRLLAEKLFDIEIHCLNIRLISISHSHSDIPTRHDPLREYYLDITQLTSTTADDVNELLNNFWQRYIAHDNQTWALQVLELSETASFDQIKIQYRRLAMRHHPDRGGDKVKLQIINEAMARLKQLYR